jgi:DivIVA domain-containing protein
MTLSLDDVRNKRFRMARKGGYEVLEVDEFVDEVEVSFGQLLEENASLKKQVDALRSSSDQAGPDSSASPVVLSEESGAAAAPTQAERPVQTEQPVQAERPAQAEQAAPVAQAAPAPQVQPVVVTTSAEASSAVVRLVQLSTEQAEHLVREANEEAAQIREDASRNAAQVTEDARTRAERLESEARVNAERVQAEAQTRSQSLEQELASRRTELFGDLDRQRDSLTETVARLRDFEQKYRVSLHDHLTGQLSSLESVDLEPAGGPERTAPQQQPAAVAGDPQPGDDPRTDGPQERTSGNGSTPAQGSGTSDTPRLDALLGDQR